VRIRSAAFRLCRAACATVHEKTGGNPFSPFSSFPRSPKRGCSLRYDPCAGAGSSIGFMPRGTPTIWPTSWSKLTRLPVQTQAALQQLACLRNVADITLLSIVLGKSAEDVRSDLWHAVRLELIEQRRARTSHPRPCQEAGPIPSSRKRLRAEAQPARRQAAPAHTPRTAAKRPFSKSSISSTAAPP